MLVADTVVASGLVNTSGVLMAFVVASLALVNWADKGVVVTG